jgi:hypothetical protein
MMILMVAVAVILYADTRRTSTTENCQEQVT